MQPNHKLAAVAMVAAVFSAGAVSAAELAPRAPGAKQSYQSMRAMASVDRVVVKFREGARVRLVGSAFSGLTTPETGALAAVLSASGAGPTDVSRLHDLPEAKLDSQRAAAEAESGRKLADLNLYFTVKLPAGADAAAVADRLNALPFVEFAEPAPVPAPLPIDIAPTTPKFVSQQGYLKPGPGVGALSGEEFPGGDGAGMRVVDLEYSWQFDHEDLELPSDRMLTGGQTASDPFNDTNHGTAVLGEMIAQTNRYGVTGIAPKAEAYVAAANTVEGRYNPSRAILVAGERLRRGDVLILEQQYWVCGYPTGNNRYGPIETLQAVFDAVSTLTARGVIVTAAAGNGNVNLDAPECGTTFNRSVRDSGAIIVGAGAPSDRSRLSFSSYGSRVDVQGWGQSVTTTGYGALFNPGDIRQRYTSAFNGTSSATPIVTGAALAIQGVRKACGLKPLKPAEMRAAMIGTGAKQGGDLSTPIGPLPRIIRALKATDAKACVTALEARGASAVTASAD
jgi:serine protease